MARNHRRILSSCPLCGRPLIGSMNRDHVYPRAIYKWMEHNAPAEEYDRALQCIESDENQIVTHEACNYYKQDGIPKLNRLHVTDGHRKRLETLHQSLEFAIDHYIAHKNALLQQQESCCYSCGIRLPDEGILRRIDPALPRTWDNGCVVCPACNRAKADFLKSPEK